MVSPLTALLTAYRSDTLSLGSSLLLVTIQVLSKARSSRTSSRGREDRRPPGGCRRPGRPRSRRSSVVRAEKAVESNMGGVSISREGRGGQQSGRSLAGFTQPVYKTVRKIAAARLTGRKKPPQISGFPWPEMCGTARPWRKPSTDPRWRGRYPGRRRKSVERRNWCQERDRCDHWPKTGEDGDSPWENPGFVCRGGRFPPFPKLCFSRHRSGNVVGGTRGRVAHGQIGVTTGGAVRAAGGDVVRTSGRSPHHATLIGLSPDVASHLLTPTDVNPAKRP